MSYTEDFNVILEKQKIIRNANMFVMKNNKPNTMKVFPEEISGVALARYFDNLKQVVQESEFVSYIPNSIEKGTLQVIPTDALALWELMLMSRNQMSLTDVTPILVTDYNCDGNMILMDIEFQDGTRVYFLTIYRNVATWYRNNIRFTKLESGKFHEESGSILALTPYVDAVISDNRCYIINEQNFNQIFKFDTVVRNQIAAHESEIKNMKFVAETDKFMEFLGKSKRLRNAMAKVIMQNRLERIKQYSAAYIRQQIESQPKLSHISYTEDDKIKIDKESFKVVVGILCGTINLDLITRELNGLDDDE